MFRWAKLQTAPTAVKKKMVRIGADSYIENGNQGFASDLAKSRKVVDSGSSLPKMPFNLRL
ncbi:MAG: hypothetical protein IKO23_09050, partial [Bacteroidales bacterium]|nr:hypothetical protein [Bacteroidales bacterium]